MKYNAIVINQNQKKNQIEQKDFADIALNTNDKKQLIIKSSFSGINYKDALGLTFTAPIYKTDVITPGIDVSGIVYQSNSRKFKEGDLVLVNGMGLGESYDGGFSEYVRVSEDVAVKLPEGLSLQEAMVLGTSGFTAALAIHRMIENGQDFEKGPILVSGASGGVGQFSIQILSQLGFFVEAVTSRMEHSEEIERLGAHYVSSLLEHLGSPKRPLEKAVWGGMIDNLGGAFLESVIPRIELWGNIACIGLTLGSEFSSTVMPFILRGVSLLGASSNNSPMSVRNEIWEKLGQEWKPAHLDSTLNQVISLEQVNEVAETLISKKHKGKTIIKLN